MKPNARTAMGPFWNALAGIMRTAAERALLPEIDGREHAAPDPAFWEA